MRATIAALALIVFIGCATPQLAEAQTTNVQGVAGVGSPDASIRPVLTGLDNGGNNIAASGDSSGNARVTLRSGATALTDANGVKVQGPVASGGAALGGVLRGGGVSGAGTILDFNVTAQSLTNGGSPNVLAVGGQDGSNLARVLPVMFTGQSASSYPYAIPILNKDGAGNLNIAVIETATNCHHVTSGINAVLDTVSYSGVKTSNGTTAVQIFAGVASKRTLVGKLSAINTSGSVSHTVSILDSSTGTILIQVLVPSGGTFILDDQGIIRAGGGADLQFKIDAGGVGTDVTVTCAAVQK